MSELKNRIRQTLNELHAELDNVEEVDPEIRSLLLQASQEIDDKIKPTEDEDAVEVAAGEEDTEPDSLNDRLAEAARHFEETHPTLSGIISTLANGLSQLGI